MLQCERGGLWCLLSIPALVARNCFLRYFGGNNDAGMVTPPPLHIISFKSPKIIHYIKVYYILLSFVHMQGLSCERAQRCAAHDPHQSILGNELFRSSTRPVFGRYSPLASSARARSTSTMVIFAYRYPV